MEARAPPPPRTLSYHPHSAQRQIARARAVGSVTAPTPAHPAPKEQGQRAPAARLEDTCPPRTARPPGGWPGPAALVLWARGVPVWGPVTDRSCKLALRAVGVAGGRPWGGASCIHEGCLCSGTLPVAFPPRLQNALFW